MSLGSRSSISANHARKIRQLHVFIDWIMTNIYPSMTQEEQRICNIFLVKFKNVLDINMLKELHALNISGKKNV